MASSIERDILESLAEFTDALANGEVGKRLTCRQVKLNLEPTHYGPNEVKIARKILGVSQTLFAKFLGVSPKTVRSWEQGLSTPSTMASRFLDEIRRKPDYWTQLLRDAVTSKS